MSPLGAGHGAVPEVISAEGCEENCCLCLVCSCSILGFLPGDGRCCILGVCVTLWVLSPSSGHILG